MFVQNLEKQLNELMLLILRN